MDLKNLEQTYRALEADMFRMRQLKQRAESTDDQLFWYLEIEATKKEMKKIAICVDQEWAKKMPKAA